MAGIKHLGFWNKTTQTYSTICGKKRMRNRSMVKIKNFHRIWMQDRACPRCFQALRKRADDVRRVI